MVFHGFAPMDLRISTLVPIPKNKRKSINTSENYRAIALSSVIGKILDNVLLLKYHDVFNTSSMQYGFKKKHGTTQCTFVVNEIVKYYMNNGSNVYVTLLDASKAFDRVNYVKLFRLLAKRNLCPVVLRFLIVFYTNQSIRVQWSSSISETSYVKNGVKQGGVLSPILFTVYIDELLCRLRDSHIGCHIGSTFCGAVGYADDVTLLAPTITSLNFMLDICKSYAESYDVLFNSTKSKLLYFGRPQDKPAVSPVQMNDVPIEMVENDKHLGNMIGHDDFKLQLQESICNFNGKTNMVMSHFCHIAPDKLYCLFRTYCMPLYGCQIWNYDSNLVDGFFTAWRKAIRKLFRLPYRCHSDLLPYIVDDIHPTLQLYRRVQGFIKSMSKSDNSITHISYKLALRGSGSHISNSMSILSNICSVSREQVCCLNASNINLSQPHNEALAIRASVIRDMIHLRHSNNYTILTIDEINHILNVQCTE